MSYIALRRINGIHLTELYTLYKGYISNLLIPIKLYELCVIWTYLPITL